MDSKKPYLAAILCQIAFAGMSLLSKAAFASGMNVYIFLFYRQATGNSKLISRSGVQDFHAGQFRIRKASGMAKVGGIIVCIAGVAVLAFYKGPYMKPFFKHHLFEAHESHVSSPKTWILGCFLLLFACISWGLWFVLQALILKTGSSPLVLTCGQTLSSALQSFVVAIAVERNTFEWQLDPFLASSCEGV
ncbi:WAT1-related protein, partial [Cucurbita argyrosperma subsp. argyrosperma]